MNPDERDLATTLTAKITSIRGVRGLFPSHTIAAAALTAISSGSAATSLVTVDTRGGIIRVAARLATDRSTRSPDIINMVDAAVAATVGAVPYALRIELSHID